MHTNDGAHSTIRGMAGITLLTLASALTLGQPTPASAAMTQISGTGVFDTAGTICTNTPEGFDDYPPIVLSGSLEGCWYTKILTYQNNKGPSGIYLETGTEIFEGSLNGGPEGRFTTTYKFESKWDPQIDDPDAEEIHGRCQHPLVPGSGTSGFAGATGRVDFKDIVEDGSFVYKGHIMLP